MIGARNLLRLSGVIKGQRPFRAQRFSSTAMRLSTETDKPVQVKQESSKSEAQDYFVRPTRIPSDMEKKILVWTGRFKTADEIPSRLPYETLDRANSKARIKIANYMMLATIVGCIFYIISGKRAAARGESVHKMNLDWHTSLQDASKTEK